MNDDVLNQAIAEELGWTKLSLHEPPLGLPGPSEYCGYNLKGYFGTILNYTGDIAVAFNLPLETNDEKRKFAIELAKIVIPDINIGTAGIVYEAAIATARQRSEAWYSARSPEIALGSAGDSPPSTNDPLEEER